MKGNKDFLIAGILFALGAVLWAANVFLSWPGGGPVDTSFILKCCCVVLFSAASVVPFLRFRRSRHEEDDK